MQSSIQAAELTALIEASRVVPSCVERWPRMAESFPCHHNHLFPGVGGVACCAHSDREPESTGLAVDAILVWPIWRPGQARSWPRNVLPWSMEVKEFRFQGCGSAWQLQSNAVLEARSILVDPRNWSLRMIVALRSCRRPCFR